MKRLALGLLVLLAACGDPKPAVVPVQPLPSAKPATAVTAPASREPLFVEYVAIERKWVTKYVPDGADDVKAWAATAKLEPSFFWILAKTDGKADPKATEAAAKKRAQTFVDRLKKGESFGKIADESSDDPGSRGHGGEYAAENVKNFVPEVVAAFQALKPGETSGIVKSSFGFAILRKAPPSNEELARLYRSAKSAETTKKLGAELTARLRASPSNSRAAIADAVQAVLGDSAVADPDRPKVSVVDRERVKDLHHVSAGAKAGLAQFADGAHAGDFLEPPAADDEMVVVARVVLSKGG